VPLLKGIAFLFGDDISTDHITPGRFFHLRSDIAELAKHTLEDADPTFCKRVKPGDFIVAGNNFGLGSSREHAPRVIKECGVAAILAKSFARIFYRNAINIGLPLLVCDTSGIEASDELEISLEEGLIRNLTKHTEIRFIPIPESMRELLADGGLAEHIKKHGGFKL
jgi:3-isopropylmalate/(R)-2-methylmalate dehydratase small subunit